MASALARGRGANFGLEDLYRTIAARGLIREEGSRRLTNRELLRCELELVLAVRDGRNCHAPFASGYEPAPDLTDEQARAARRILGSEDFATVFRGGAGTGKSHTLKEIDRALSEAGHPVVILAPQRQQVDALEADGLRSQTLARALAALSVGSVVDGPERDFWRGN